MTDLKIDQLTEATLDAGARVWEQTVCLPTYPHGRPNPNPMFLDKRVYQGSSGAVYPFPVIDQVGGDKRDQSYRAVFLENRFLKIMILPELGGRVHMAYDKLHDYHFVYFNRVIKPALVGLAGPWISGGIEFNWPQHHRPSTFSPVEHRLAMEPDGGATVWISEIDRMARTKMLAGFTLEPNKAYLRINVKLYNRTSEPQSFLWWANPAVAAHDDYQSVFPPDVCAVMDHGKRDVSDFPIAKGEYYKVDYSPGTDISRYRNIPVPTSYMAHHSEFDFLGGYDHGRRMGLLHVANHHFMPGKKQWTWGNGDFGRAWDRELTDEDGPYVELMVGAFTDNQPDFTWLAPGEEKSFTQYFMPYSKVGMIKNASKDLRLNLDRQAGKARIAVGSSSELGRLRVVLFAQDKLIWEQSYDASPTNVLEAETAIDASTPDSALKLAVYDQTGEVLLSYQPNSWREAPTPEPAREIGPPEMIETNEELYLAGLHLEQYRHATREPADYYHEALRRDPLDARCNNALGLLLYRRGRFDLAEKHFRNAIARLTSRNPNPDDGQAHYNLGLTLIRLGQIKEAEDALWESTWSAAWRASALFVLAQLACRAGEYESCLSLLDRVLSAAADHHQARHLQIVVLRKLNRMEQARAQAERAVALDPMNFGVLFESSRMDKDDDQDALVARMSRRTHNVLELAFEYTNAGFWTSALEALSLHLDATDQPYPMALYLQAWSLENAGDAACSSRALKQAADACSDYCFPNSLDEQALLIWAISRNPRDAKAPYYLGDFWYVKKQADLAISAWEQSVAINPAFSIAQRNLGLAYYNHIQDAGRAMSALIQAFESAPDDARVLYELDQLHKQIGSPIEPRLARLEAHVDLTQQRDDLLIERLTLMNCLGRHDEVLAILAGRTFHPWEGGEGRVTGQYRIALIQTARGLMERSCYRETIDKLEAARCYPPHLGEDKLVGQKDNDILYWQGCCFEAMGQTDQARSCFESASQGGLELGAARYYNDQPPEMVFYAAMAQHQLGLADQATAVFERMIEFAQTHRSDQPQIDYFAVSLPDFLVFDQDLSAANHLHCLFMEGLGRLGLGRSDKADDLFDQVLASRPDHQPARFHRCMSSALQPMSRSRD